MEFPDPDLGLCRGLGVSQVKGKFPKVVRGRCKKSFEPPREQRSPKSLCGSHQRKRPCAWPGFSVWKRSLLGFYSIRKALDTFKFLRHVMRAILSVRPKRSHRCVSLKETPLKPVQILNTQPKTQPSKPLWERNGLNISRFKLFRRISYSNNFPNKTQTLRHFFGECSFMCFFLFLFFFLFSSLFLNQNLGHRRAGRLCGTEERKTRREKQESQNPPPPKQKGHIANMLAGPQMTWVIWPSSSYSLHNELAEDLNSYKQVRIMGDNFLQARSNVTQSCPQSGC